MDLRINKKNIVSIITVIAFIIFIAVSLKFSLFSNHSMWRDEAHAWTIAQYCSIPQAYKLMHIEGHTLLWYLVLMPFAKLNFGYPVVMELINWLFMSGALILVLCESRINAGVKCLLFLSPILMYYSIFARCYSIGVFFLFLACFMYEKRLKRPFIYFLVLFLAGNTSILALFCAIGIGIPFLIDLYSQKFKNKNERHIPILITILTLLAGTVLFFQFIPFSVPDYANSLSKMNFSLFKLDVFAKILIFLYFGAFIIFVSKPKPAFIYAFSMISSLIMFYNIYRPFMWHIYFLFIYLIVSYWIFISENPKGNMKKCISTLLIILCILCLPLKRFPKNYTYNLPEVIKSYIGKQTDIKIYSDIAPTYLSSIIADLNKDKIFIYDMNGRNLSYYEGLITYFDSIAKKISLYDFCNTILPKGRSLLLFDKDSYKNYEYIKDNEKNIKWLTNFEGYYLFEIIKD